MNFINEILRKNFTIRMNKFKERKLYDGIHYARERFSWNAPQSFEIIYNANVETRCTGRGKDKFQLLGEILLYCYLS